MVMRFTLRVIIMAIHAHLGCTVVDSTMANLKDIGLNALEYDLGRLPVLLMYKYH
jgi:hypothetical protein